MKNTLDRLIDLIKQNKNYKINIYGYTDDIGDDNFNLELSQNRSNSVKNYLLKNNIENYINSKGFGEKSPKYDNKNKTLKCKNRRVELFFY